MKILLGYLFVAFVVGLRAGNANRMPRQGVLVLSAFVLAASFLSLRVINE